MLFYKLNMAFKLCIFEILVNIWTLRIDFICANKVPIQIYRNSVSVLRQNINAPAEY